MNPDPLHAIDEPARHALVHTYPSPAIRRLLSAVDERLGRALAVAAYVLRERQDSRAVDGGNTI
jgi:hypothetical protein